MKEKLSLYEVNYDWKSSILLLNSIDESVSKEEKLDITVRVMFLVAYWFLEGNYEEEQEKEGEVFLKKTLKDSLKEFENYSDYLFCIGVITRLNENYFDFDLDQPDEFLKRAIFLSPEIKLYKDWMLVRDNQFVKDKEYLFSPFISEWKKNKGMLGNYVIDYLRNKTLLQ